MDYETRYRDLWSKYYRLSLRDTTILDEEISQIDEQIRRLQERRNSLVARKHQEYKERFAAKFKE